MYENPVKITDILNNEFTDFLNYCKSAGKTYASQLSNADYIAYRTSRGYTREETDKIKSIIADFKPSDLTLFTPEPKNKSDADINFQEAKADEDTFDVQTQISQNSTNEHTTCKDDTNKQLVELASSFDIEDLQPNNSFANLTLANIFDINPEKFTNVKIIDLNLGVRATRCLYRVKCLSLADLLEYTPYNLSKIRNLGKLTYEIIFDIVKNFIGSYKAREIEYDISDVINDALFIDILEAYLLTGDENTDNFTNNQKAVFEEVKKAVDVLGPDMSFYAHRNHSYSEDIAAVLNGFSASVTSISKALKSASKEIRQLPPSILNLNLRNITALYIKSTKANMQEIEAECDENDTVSSFINKLKDEKQDTPKMALIANQYAELLLWLSEGIEAVKNYPAEITSKINFGNREYDVLQKRAKGETLEEVGAYFNVTRERIRQIEKKAYGKLIRYLSFLKYNPILFAYIISGTPQILKEENINAIYGNAGELIWQYAIKTKSEKYYYSKNLDAVIINFDDTRKLTTDFDERLEKTVKALPDHYFIDDEEQIIGNAAEKYGIPFEFLINHVKSVYKTDGKLAHSKQLTKRTMLEYILKNHFPAGLKIADEYVCNRVLKYATELFGEAANGITQKIIDVRIGDIGYLCDRGKYIHPDYLNVEPRIINKIYDYIKNSPRTAIPYGEIFEALQDEFQGTQITNRYILQGALKKYGCKYYSSRDFIKKTSSADFLDDFSKFVESREYVNADELLSEFLSLNDATLPQIVSRCTEVLQDENSYYFHSSSLDLREEDYESIYVYLKNATEKIPVNAKALFDDFTLNFYNFMQRNGINGAFKLFSVLSYMFGDKFSFRRPYVAKDDVERPTKKKTLLKLLEDYNEISIDELQDICDINKINYNGFTYIIDDLAPEFYKNDAETLIRSDFAGITPDVIDRTVEIVTEMIMAKGYLQVYKIDDFLWFPEIEVDWSPTLIESICKNSGKVPFVSYHSSANANIGAVFLTDKYKAGTYEAFIVALVKEELARGSFSTKEELHEWLNENALNYGMLPKCLREDTYFYTDDRGRMKLTEEFV